MAPERLELGCEISKVEAPVRWFRDGLEVKEGPNLTLEADGAQRRLIIPITTADDTGEYVCDTQDDSVAFVVTVTGENVQRQSQVDTAALLVSVFNISSFFTVAPPVKLSRPPDMPEKLAGYAGEPIVLEAEVSRPNAVVKWWLNGREIVGSSSVTMTADGFIHRLTIRSPTPEDSGTYSCDAIDDKIDFHVAVTGKNLGEGSCGLMCFDPHQVLSCSIRAASGDPEEVGDRDPAQVPGI